MTVTLNLNPELERDLIARAQTRGISLDDYILELVAKEARVPLAPNSRSTAQHMNSSIIFPTYSSILPLREPILISSDPKTTRARLTWDEWLSDRYECTVGVQPAWESKRRLETTDRQSQYHPR